MTLKGTNMNATAAALWERRNAALERSAALMDEKPDIADWTRQERRTWLYAMAIGRRLERMN